MQNPGRFILDASEFRSRVLSMPRNPSIIKFFRHPKLSENAGYGIDKIIRWKELTGYDVNFDSDLLISTLTYPLAKSNTRQANISSGEINGEIKKVLYLITQNPNITQRNVAEKLGYSERKVNRIVSKLRKLGMLAREGSNKTGRWVVNKKL